MLPKRILFIIISGFVLNCCSIKNEITFFENTIVNNSSDVKSRQPKVLSFFPTEHSSNEQNYIDNNHTEARQYYSPASSGDTAGEQIFTFSNNARPVNPSNNYEFNTGEYVNTNPINYVTINPQRQHLPPPTSSPQRRPYSIDQRPQGNYAQYFNYNTPQNLPFYNNDVRPQISRPQRPPPSNNYYYPNQNQPVYQSQLPHNFNINKIPNSYGGINGPQINSPGNYAGNYQNYQNQDSGNPITNLFNNIGQGASNLLNGGINQPNSQPHPGYQQQQQQQYPGDPSNPVSQFGKAIEEITRHDDLQCIPKIICQMVGNQRRQNSLSPLLGSPVFSSLISAVPSTSAGLVYGRAALLGYTAGEHRCDGAYPKCPRNEDNLLYYLNNHRGGFFRFFNGGAAYGNPDEIQYNPNYHNYNLVSNDAQQQNQQQQPFSTDSTATNLALLTGLANAINQSGGINLSNLGANSGVLGNIANFVGGMTNTGGGLGSSLFSSQTGGGVQDATSTGTYNVGEIFSNLLTGFVGNRFTSRNIKKRSVDTESINEKFQLVNSTESSIDNSVEKLKNSNVTALKENMKPENSSTISQINDPNDEDEKEEIFAEDEYDDETITSDTVKDIRNDEDDVPEGRIINLKNPILAINPNNKIQFPNVDKNNIRDGKKVQFIDSGNKHESFQQSANKDILLFDTNIKGPNVFQLSDQSNNELHFSKKKIKFDNDNNFINQIVGPTPLPLLFDTNRGSKKIKFNNDKLIVRLPNGINPPSVDRVRMVFPDRTGTGNLRFDNDEFNQNEHQIRFGRILTGSRLQQQSHQSEQNPTNFNSENLNYYDRYQSQINRYGSDNQQQPFNSQSSNNYYQQQRPIAVASYPALPSSSSSSLHSGNNNYYTNNNSNYNKQNNYNSNSQQATNSENIYVTNSKGVVEYYINPAGNKVYV